MILVVSRFKTQAGLEEAVRRSFRDRPRPVDHEPGVLVRPGRKPRRPL